MRYFVAFVFVAFVVIGALSACTTVEVVAPEPTQEASYWEQEWVDGWIEDGSSATEGRCMWQAMIDFYGTEVVLVAAISELESADMWDDLNADPAFDACWD